MPIDDLRTRPAAALPVVDEADDERDDHGHEGSKSTPERLAEIEAAQLAQALQDLKDYDEGRIEGIPWEVAKIGLFDPPTAEELAEEAAEERSRRARR